MRKNKYEYYKIIQTNHGYGWDDDDFHATDSAFNVRDRTAFKTNLQAYKDNCQCSIRVINRKEPTLCLTE